MSLITNGIQVIIDQHVNALKEKEKETTPKVEVKKTTTNTKKTSSKTTNKKTSSTKKTTSVVTKKEVSKAVTYTKATGSATGESIVSYAKKFLGLRYKTGTPSLSKGADCSGFTMLIFKEYGISLPRTVGGQSKKGTAVSKKNLQKGDLVFFRPKGGRGLSHVAIYIGGGKVIHETRPGRGVAITSVDGLSNIVFVTARRVINSNSAKVAEKKVEEQNKTVTDNASKTIDTNNTQNIKNEGNVNNNVVNNVTTVASTPTPTPVVETKVEVTETKVEKKEESTPTPTPVNTEVKE